MDEYIEREALITKFKKMELGEHGLVERLFADGVYAVIAAFPSADVAPVVHGKDLASPSLFQCSVCGCEDDDTYTCDVSEYRYCPNCGAKIDEKAKPEPSVVTIYKCSGCGTRSMEFSKGDHFCFFCGAKMDEREDTQ